MRGLKSLILSLLICCAKKADAQASVTIKGDVVDDKQMGVPFVNVTILKAGDSLPVAQIIAMQNGRYEIPCPQKTKVILRYENVGYQTYYSATLAITSEQSYRAPCVQLQRKTGDLEKVTISSSKRSVRMSADKTVFNVSGTINSAGSSALELLQKTPGIQLDNNDHISFKGKADIKIYIDGKLIQLANDELSAYLKSINSNNIDEIEIINNPGAQYDASGNAGIINIKLKKNKNFGTKADLTIGLIKGKNVRGNDAMSINYRNKKLSIFSNTGISYGNNEIDIHALRIQKDTAYDQNLQILNAPTSFNLKSGIDYSIGRKQIIGVMVTSNLNKEAYQSASNTAISYYPASSYVETLLATNKIPRTRSSVDYNLNYKYADSSGKEINFDADYSVFRGRANSDQENFFTNEDNSILSHIHTLNNTPTDINIYTAKLDVIRPLKKGNIIFGAKSSYVKTNNVFDIFNVDNGNATLASDESYHFLYEETVNAVYVSYKRIFHQKLTILTGLRAEHTHSDGMLTMADGTDRSDNQIVRNYLDLFPSAAIAWSASANDVCNLFYNRRIDRPGYQDLNPFEIKLDELSYVKGNPFLRPQYTNSFEVVNSWKNMVNISIGFNHVKDYATQTTDTLGNHTYVQQKNIATQNIATAGISSSMTLNSWWQLYASLWFNYQVFKGQVKDSYLNVSMPGYGINVQQTFTLGNGFTADMNGWLKGPSALTPTFRTRTQAAVDIGVQKSLFGARATLKFVATDLLRTSVPLRAKSDFGGLQINIAVAKETQTVRISFTYRFGSSKIKDSRKRQTAAEAEIKRVKDN